MSEAITLSKSARLVELEKQIARGLSTFIEVGEALMTVRDEYRHDFETLGYKNFEDYCEKKWKMSRVHAHRLIAASETAEMLPVGNKPTTERQVRPLTSLPREQQPAAWEKAVEMADGEQPTAKQVEAAVEVIAPRRERISYTPSNALQYAQMAIDNLAKIQPTDTQRNKAFQKVINWIEQQEN